MGKQLSPPLSFLPNYRQSVTQRENHLLYPVVGCHKVVEMQDALRLQITLTHMLIHHMTSPQGIIRQHIAPRTQMLQHQLIELQGRVNSSCSSLISMV